MVEAVTLVGAEHHEEPVDNALCANWPNNNEWRINGRHDPLSGHDVVQVADVVAVQMGKYNGGDHWWHEASTNNAHHTTAATVDHDVLITRLYQSGRTSTMWIWHRASGAQKCDFHGPSFLRKA